MQAPTQTKPTQHGGVNIAALSCQVSSLRRSQQLTRKELQKITNVDCNAILRVEKQQGVPSIATIKRLCHWLRRPLSAFIADGYAGDAREAEPLTGEPMMHAIAARLQADGELSQEQADALMQLLRVSYASVTKETK